MITTSIRSVGEIMNDLVGQTKADLIRDCMNYQRLLFGFGCDQYKGVVITPEDVFDKLHDTPVDELQAFNFALSSACSRKAYELINNNR